MDVVETPDRRSAAPSEEDLLEIPAFLRRQAN
jgi:cell division protein FtsZ